MSMIVIPRISPNQNFVPSNLACLHLLNWLKTETALTDGDLAVRSFKKERLFANEKSFNDLIHRKSRCSFGKPPKCPVSKFKVIKSNGMENRAMSEAVRLTEKQQNFSLPSLFEFCIIKECLAIFNINETLQKCQKSKLVHQMNFTELQVEGNYTTK